MRQHLTKLVLFGIVGTSGVCINSLLLFIFTSFANAPVWLASIIATETSIISNFFGNHYLTFRNTTNKSSLKHKFLKFQVVSLIALTITVTILTLLTTKFGSEPWWLLQLFNLVAIGSAFIINFILNLKYTWAEERV